MPHTCPNGIVSPDAWPPRDVNLNSWTPLPVPWLEQPPEIIPIDGGRQLLTDDFLVADTSMARAFHQPVKHPGNPVFFADSPEECRTDYPPGAVARFGVWHDPQDRLFKMWYMAGYAGGLAYAESRDGLCWRRPALDVVPGTNLCLPRDIHPDSGTVWLDQNASNPAKLLLREPDPLARARGRSVGGSPALAMTSPDGRSWSAPVLTGPMGDRSSMFFNPFRGQWVQSIRSGGARGRCRRYWEGADFHASTQWTSGQPAPWQRADCLDQGGDSLPQLYTLEAVAYESLLLGLFQIYKGPPNNIGELTGTPKLTELVAGYSRDGFHWHRPDRRAFIGAVRVPGAWEHGYVEASGGVCLVVNDELWFYYSAYAGDAARADQRGIQNGMYSYGAVGLARLRRDGFASMQARFAGAHLLTRPLTFSGSRLFVNANTAGSALRVAIIGPDNQSLPGCAAEDCLPFAGNHTRAEIRWKNDDTLRQLRGRPVRFRFTLDRGELFSFWVTDAADGASGGYLGAGGPGFKSNRDI